MTSHTTTAPFTLDDLFKILPLTSSAESKPLKLLTAVLPRLIQCSDNIDQRCLGAVGLIGMSGTVLNFCISLTYTIK